MAGVSKSSVSYALNGNGRVAADTRERVQEAARQLGYQARRPAAGKAITEIGTIGAILSPTRHEGETPNYFVAELLAGVEREARLRNIGVRVSMWVGRLPAMATDGTVDGLLYLGGAFDPAVLRSLVRPAVVVGTSFSQLDGDAVLADNRRGMYLATSHLLASGCRQIALLNGPRWAPTSDSKWLGFRDALQEQGFDPDGLPVTWGDFSLEAGYQMARNLLGQNPKVDGIVAGDDPIAIGALHAAQDLRIGIPGQLRITGYGDSPTGRLLRPQLSTVRVFQQEMGTLAVRRLLERLEGGFTGSVRILVNPELVIRDSSDA
jgi:DNA-binding LacI/PurR family transcriptional regulator